MRVGYARVSTVDQELAMQRDALSVANCERVFTDTASGAKQERVGLHEALEFVRAGDVLEVWRLHRLARSLKHLIELVTQLQDKGAQLKSLHESIDTPSNGPALRSTHAKTALLLKAVFTQFLFTSGSSRMRLCLFPLLP